MFRQIVSPFACILISLVVCVMTFVGTVSYTSKKDEEQRNKLREEWSQYTKYNTLNDLAPDELDNINKLVTLIDMLNKNSIREFDNEDIWEVIYKSLPIGTKDKYGQYYTKEELEKDADNRDGNYVGIGVNVVYDNETTGAKIYRVIPNSSAEKAGIKAGDVIIGASGIETSEENYMKMINSILGEEGTDANVKIKRGNEVLDFTITRAQVMSENVIYEKLNGDIAYLKIITFSDSTLPDQFADKLAKAQEDGCKKYIFDVRHNNGGLLNSIIGVLDPILPEGPIMHTVDNYGKIETVNSDEECFDAPMVVLCDSQTASAAELFAAALRDYELAVLIGETTYGKGSMQTTQPLPDGSAIKMTTAFYNPPSNVSYDSIGIKPDHEVKLEEEWSNNFYLMPRDKDTQLAKAIEVLNSAK